MMRQVKASKTKLDVSEQIFDATDRLMAKEGLHYLSMHKLAKEAGIAAGTIYLYFKSKDELLAQFARRVFNKFVVAIEEGLVLAFVQVDGMTKIVCAIGLILFAGMTIYDAQSTDGRAHV